MVCNPLYYRELYPYQCRVPIMGWMTMAHVPCFAMAHIDFIKSWLAGLVYWPHAFPLMRIYNGDIHIIYIYISCYPATKTGLGVSRLVMAMSIGEVLYQRAKSGYIKNMPAVECITYIICVCTYIYMYSPESHCLLISAHERRQRRRTTERLWLRRQWGLERMGCLGSNGLMVVIFTIELVNTICISELSNVKHRLVFFLGRLIIGTILVADDITDQVKEPSI
jgi:hypothetical protein